MIALGAGPSHHTTDPEPEQPLRSRNVAVVSSASYLSSIDFGYGRAVVRANGTVFYLA